MKRNKLLTGFLVLGLGLSLVACSSNEPEEKVEEKKIEETKAIEEKEEKVKEEKKEEEKAKAAEEEKEKDSTIISYANKKVRVTLPKDLTSFHTPARELSRYSYMEESNVLGYSLYAKDRTFTIHFSIGTDGWDSAEAASISHNKVCKDESKMGSLFITLLLIILIKSTGPLKRFIRTSIKDCCRLSQLTCLDLFVESLKKRNL